MKINKLSFQPKTTFKDLLLVAASMFVIFCTLIYFYHNNFLVTAQSDLEPNTKIAFIGDSYYGEDFKRNLNMIKSEDADIIMHQGDLDYEDNPKAFFEALADVDLDKDGKTRNDDGSLDLDFPYFITEGNHDYDSWSSDCINPNGCYVNYIKQIYNNLGITTDDENLNDQNYAIKYKGIKMVSTGEELSWEENASFVDRELKKEPVLWQFCTQHKTQHTLQLGDKPDEVGWELLENCRKEGAIIASAHEHSYSRTKTLVNMPNLTVDSNCSSPNSLCLGNGKTFSFISGVGGADVRFQKRCLPSTYPYGCNGEWANLYTLNHPLVPSQIPWNEPGALFINIYVNGDERKAEGYFKLANGMVLDNFTIYNSKQLTPILTSTPTHTNTPTPSPTPVIKTLNLLPVADTFVTADKPNTNMADQKIIKVKNNAKKIILMRFDLTALAGKTIKSANLKMNIIDPSISTINVKLVNNSWNLYTVNYNNKPSLSTKYLSFQKSKSGITSQDFMTVVLANKGKVVSLALETSGTDELTLSSTEESVTSRRPQLEIAYQ